MKNNRFAFTLVEVLAVIVVLGILAIVITPTVLSTLNNNKESAYEMVISDFKAAAQEYINDNRGQITELESFNNPYVLTLETLANGGYIELPVVNPKTNDNFATNFTITVRLLENGSFVFQTAEGLANNPTMVLNGSDPDTVACHAFNNYTDPGAEVTDPQHENVPTVYSLTTLPLSTAGTYNLTYSYFNIEGGFASDSREVTITNNNTPIISIEGGDATRTISEGDSFTPPNASAADPCEANIATTYVSNVDVNTVGTYTVTYSATNSTGHTGNKNLTVEVVASAPDWDWEKELVIDHNYIDSNLTNFPVTVILDSSNFDFTKAKADGTDIKFVNTLGNTLDFERELHDSANERAVYHVKIPSISSTADTTFYMWFDNDVATDMSNTEGVWDSSYVMVQHMGSSLLDSTSNNNDGTNSGTVVVDSQVGKGRDFTNDYITVPDSPSLSPNNLTVSGLIRLNGWTNDQRIVVKETDDNPPYGTYQLIVGREYYNPTTYDFPQLRIATDGARKILESPDSIALNQYYYISGTYDGSTIRVYENGTQKSSVSENGTFTTTSNPVHIGNSIHYVDRDLKGIIDEVRMSSVARSNAWIKAEYNCLLDNVLTYGTDVSRSGQGNSQYKVELVISSANIDSTLTDFPVTVRLNANNFDFFRAKADGTDVRFVDSIGNPLDFEREYHDSAEEIAVYHVRIPTLSSSANTTIYLQFGDVSATDAANPTGVWDSNYVMVQHMGDNMNDSTSNGINASFDNTTVVPGIVGKAREFDGDDDYISFANADLPASIFGNGSRTVTILHYNNDDEDSPGQGPIFGSGENLTNKLFSLIHYFEVTEDTFKLQFETNAIQTELALWERRHHLYTSVYDTSVDQARLYYDYTQSGSANETLNTTKTDFFLGVRDNTPSNYLTGRIDEVRISDIARSNAWIKAEYYSLFDNLITYGDVTDIDGNAITTYIVNFDYTGGEQTWTVPATATYRIQAWGAESGGWGNASLNQGGYAKGEITLTANDTLYINIGGSGSDSRVTTDHDGYNGGGSASSASGGGATHVATASGVLSSLSGNQAAVLIVAGGAGSNGVWRGNGDGGGLIGIPSPAAPHLTSEHEIGGGTQVGGGVGTYGTGSFGQGANSSTTGSAGGGGWYGGGSSDGDLGGGGGSSYIAALSNSATIAGCWQMPDPAGGWQQGQDFDGYVRITRITY